MSDINVGAVYKDTFDHGKYHVTATGPTDETRRSLSFNNKNLTTKHFTFSQLNVTGPGMIYMCTSNKSQY